jgi:hypothetical protein
MCGISSHAPCAYQPGERETICVLRPPDDLQTALWYHIVFSAFPDGGTYERYAI